MSETMTFKELVQVMDFADRCRDSKVKGRLYAAAEARADALLSALGQPAAPALPFDGEDVANLRSWAREVRARIDPLGGNLLLALASRLEAALPGQGAEAGKVVGDSLAEVVGHDAAGDVFAEIESLRHELSEARAAINALTAATPPADPSAEPEPHGDYDNNIYGDEREPGAEPAEDVHGICNKCGYSGPCKGGRWRMRHPNCDYSAMPIEPSNEPARPTYDPATHVVLERWEAHRIDKHLSYLEPVMGSSLAEAKDALRRALEAGR